MTNWWEIEDIGSAPLPAEIRAIAYYRHSRHQPATARSLVLLISPFSNYSHLHGMTQGRM